MTRDRVQHAGPPPGIRHRSAATLLAVLAAALAFLLSVGPATASTAEAPAGGSAVAPIDDVIADERPGAPRLRAAHSFRPRSAGGLRVSVGAGLGSRRAADSTVSLLRTLLHGDEIEELRLHVATLEETQRICGGSVPACYFPETGTMVVPDRSASGYAPVELLVAHEYGHHVANHLHNDPWPAGTWGPKRWASQQRICQGVRSGAYHPRGQGQAYWSDPGEAFAQAYALYHFRGLVNWWWELPAPDEAAFEAIERDIRSPWRGPRVERYSGPLGGGSRSIPVETPLDGRVRAILEAPRGARAGLVLRSADGRLLRRARIRRGRAVLRYDVCSIRELSFEVRTRSAPGRFKLRIERP